MLVSMKSLLDKANKQNYAVGAFNINDLEIVQAIVSAAQKLNAPVILQTSEGAIKYAGFEFLKSIVYTAAKNSNVKIVLHLDHGRDMAVIKKCIKNGWTSVMIDASHEEFTKNIRLTKRVANLAHKKQVSVEGELGTIGGAEETVRSRNIILTNPETAKEFVDKTGVDALAVAIGTSHGAYKFAGGAKLDIARLKEIKKKVKLPIVLHGGSGVPKWVVAVANKYGAKLKSVEGVPDEQVKKAIKNGINKINTDTDLRLAMIAGMRKSLKQNPAEIDPRNVLGEAKTLMQKVVEHRIKLFGSAGKN